MPRNLIRGTRRPAVRSRSPSLPVTPPVGPVVPVAPIVPVGPAPRVAPAPIMPPVAPGKAKVLVRRRCCPVLGTGDVADRLANGGEPFGNPGRAGRRGLQTGRLLAGRRGRRRTE